MLDVNTVVRRLAGMVTPSALPSFDAPGALRVLHVVSSLDRRAGGTVTAVAGLARAQADAGARVAVVTSFTHGEDLGMLGELRSAGVVAEAVGPVGRRLGRWNARAQKRLSAMVTQCDVVHIHACWEEIQHRAARAASHAGKPYVFAPHGMLDPWSLSQRAWKKRLYLAMRLRRDLNHAARLHVTTRAEGDLLAPLRLTPPRLVMPNGLNLEEFARMPPRGQWRAQRNISAEKPLVLFLGRIHPKKGFDLLIPAMAQLTDLPWTLAIAGPDEGGYLNQVKKLISQHQLDDRVVCTGMLLGSEKFGALHDADLFVLPSYQENFGIAVVESLAAGTPVMISESVNLAHEVREGQVGDVVALNPEAIAASLRASLTNQHAPGTEGLRSRAQAFAFERYDWRQIAPQWLNHYKEICGIEG